MASRLSGPAALAEVDTRSRGLGWSGRCRLRDAGRVSAEVAAAVAVEQASGSTTLLRTSLLAVVAVSVGAATTPGGLLVVSPLVSRPSPLAGRLTATQRRVLEGRLRRPTAQQREVVRARIVLAAADGEQNTQTVPSEPRCSPRPAAAGWPNFTPDGQRDLR